MDEWQNKPFQEFLSVSFQVAPRTWSAVNGPPKRGVNNYFEGRTGFAIFWDF